METPLFQTETLSPPLRRRRVQVLGQKMDLVTPAEMLAFVAQAAERQAGAVVANHNLHSIYLVRRSPSMAAFYDRVDLIEVDSRPLLQWASLLGLPASGAHRCTYLDWQEDFWRMASARRWRVFYLGGAPGVAERAAERLMQRWPGVEIAVRHGFFDRTPGSDENQSVVDQVNAFRPHVLFIGMGMPIQETWIAENLRWLDVGAVLPVGAAFDYEAGVQKAAPRALGRLGLEWLFRLAHSPRRLFRRYLVEPWFLLGAAFADLARPALARKMAFRLRPASRPAAITRA